MTVELVTGKQGTPHVQAADTGALHAGFFGTGLIRLADSGGKFPQITIRNANTVNVPPMDFMIDGRHVRITGNETVGLANGKTGEKRVDLLVAQYERNTGTGVENVKLTVVKGSPRTSTPSAPQLRGSILRGDTLAQYALARIRVDGLTPVVDAMMGEQAYSYVVEHRKRQSQWQAPWSSMKLSLTRVGSMVNIAGRVTVTGSDASSGIKVNEVIPVGYRPANVGAMLGVTDGGYPVSYVVYQSGDVYKYGQIRGGEEYTFTGAWVSVDQL